MKDVLQDLLQSVEEAASQAGVVSNMIDSISKSIARVCGLTGSVSETWNISYLEIVQIMSLQFTKTV